MYNKFIRDAADVERGEFRRRNFLSRDGDNGEREVEGRSAYVASDEIH